MKVLLTLQHFRHQMHLWPTQVNSLSFLVASFMLIPFSDPKCPSRYHCTHEAGVHSVGLTWIHKLHKFLGSGEFFHFSVCFIESIKNLFGTEKQ